MSHEESIFSDPRGKELVNGSKLTSLVEELIALPKETEWVEFKCNYAGRDEIGGYLSALSNSACLHNKEKAYLLFGIENETQKVVGTSFRPTKSKVGNEELENWLAIQLEPRIDFVMHEFQYNGCSVVLIEIDPADNIPVKFKGTAYIRVGSYKKRLSDHPEKERKIWQRRDQSDWSAQICKGATLNDLDNKAILKARDQYKQKYPRLSEEVDAWDDLMFLNKARVTRQGRITRASILLLGKDESEHFLLPSMARITWLLKDEKNLEKDYAHFGPPFILNVEELFSRIRNLNYRYLPDSQLFPIELTQYEPWVIREALHNCIAHQDYSLKGRINVVEKPDELIMTNLGSFIPGDIDTVIMMDAPPEFYRNPFLVGAMVNLNMIDIIGSGIKKMFQLQRKRNFPLPDYDLSDPDRVVVKIQGKVLDENYTRLLIEHTDLDLRTVILLDKVQKQVKISKDEHRFVKSKKLVEGRYPNLFMSSKIAYVTAEQSKYIKYRGLDDTHYQELIVSFIKQYGRASREDIDNLLMNKLPDVLSKQQKFNKISRLLSNIMAKKLNLIKNIGSRRSSVWVLTEEYKDD